MIDIFFRHIQKVLLPVILVVCLLPCPLPAEEVPLKKVSFIPLWKPQAQFAGYYVAAEKGIYKKYGLDVTMLEGGPENPPIEMLEQGKADFGVVWLSSAIRRRSQGLSLVNICQVSQRSSLMLVAKKSSGIVTPEDMRGKSVGVWEGDLELQPKAFFRKYGLDVRMVPQSYTVNLFLLDGVNLASAMWYNEYDTLLDAGVDSDELSVFFFSDYGLNFPEDGIYCREETLSRDPAAAEAFVKASLEGWYYAFEHPGEAVDIVLRMMREAHLPANRGHQQWMLARMKDLIMPVGQGYSRGALNKDDFETVSRELVKSGSIPKDIDFNELYRPVLKP